MSNDRRQTLIENINEIKLKIKVEKKHGQLKKLASEIDVYNIYSNKWKYENLRIETLEKHVVTLKRILDKINKLNYIV